MRVARRQKDLVLRNRDAADAAVARRLIGTDARFPDEVAGLAVERLDDVAGAGEIHDAVVHDGRRLIRARIVHRPHPGELQIVDVVAGDLIERAVAPPEIVAPEDQPVSGRRILQHLRRHRHVVLHFASDRDAAHRRGAAAPLSAAGAGAKRHRRRRRSPSSPTAAFNVVGVLIVSACDPGAPPIRWIRYATTFSVTSSPSDARRRRRHRLHDVAEELVDGTRAPRVAEIRAGQRGRVARAGQIGGMAAGAADVVRGAPGLGLRLRVGAASARLLRDRHADEDPDENGDEPMQERAQTSRSLLGRRWSRSVRVKTMGVIIRVVGPLEKPQIVADADFSE